MDTQQGVLDHRELLSEHSRHSQGQAGHGPTPAPGRGWGRVALQSPLQMVMRVKEISDIAEPWRRMTPGGGGWASLLCGLRGRSFLIYRLAFISELRCGAGIEEALCLPRDTGR